MTGNGKLTMTEPTLLSKKLSQKRCNEERGSVAGMVQSARERRPSG
jgi:hypothetical protein